MNIKNPDFITISALFAAHLEAEVALDKQTKAEHENDDHSGMYSDVWCDLQEKYSAAEKALTKALGAAGIPTYACTTVVQKYIRGARYGVSGVAGHQHEYAKDAEALKHKLMRKYVRVMHTEELEKAEKERVAALPKNVYEALVKSEHSLARMDYRSIEDWDRWYDAMKAARTKRERYLLAHPELAGAY